MKITNEMIQTAMDAHELCLDMRETIGAIIPLVREQVLKDAAPMLNNKDLARTVLNQYCNPYDDDSITFSRANFEAALDAIASMADLRLECQYELNSHP